MHVGLLIALLVGATPSLALANPGSLDSAFGENGKLTTDVAGDDWIQAIRIQLDGKIVAVGAAGATAQGLPACAVARYNADGALDENFDGGVVMTSIPGGACEARAEAKRALMSATVYLGPGALVPSFPKSVAQCREGMIRIPPFLPQKSC